jgi:hypothetical protein
MYKRLFSIIIPLICIAISDVSGQKKLEVLFLGNSYTYVNDLPNLITQIALSKGDSLITDENDVGGYTLQAHSTDATSLSKINSRPWDYVILQEQSQRPAFPQSQVEVEVYPFADSLNKYIKNNDSCTQTVFFMTWGRKNGDASNCAFYPPICTYEGMQAGLRYSYLFMGQTLNAVVSPVGIVWKRVRNEGDSIELYSADESHPSLAGSYLAACTFYATLFQKTPVGASFIPVGLNPATAIHLQQYAHQVVFDSLGVWNIDTTKVKADFSANLNQNIISITNNSQNATSYFWDFGDGQSLSGNIASHTYSSVGDYTLKLIAFKGCTTDTMIKIIHVSVVGIENRELNSAILELYPVPASDYIMFVLPDNVAIDNYSVYNVFGQEVISGNKLIGNKIDLTNIKYGMYYIRMSADKILYSGKFQLINRKSNK